MLLVDFRARNYRCFEDIQLCNLDRLAVLIGENDAGKTVLLDAIELLVSGQQCMADCYRRLADGSTVDQVILEATFLLESHDTLPDEYRSGMHHEYLRFKRLFRMDSMETFVHGRGYSDERFDGFVGADNQRALLIEYGLRPASREAERRAQREELIESGKLEYVEREVKLTQFTQLLPHLPRVERISSTDYKAPNTMIQQTLRAVAASVIAPIDPATGVPVEIAELVEVRQEIDERINLELGKAQDILRRIHPRLNSFRVEPSIDFTRAVSTGKITVDVGEGGHLLDAFGEGTKRRIWMGLLEWQLSATHDNVSGSVIRLYDEPDANLHYEAQRQLFNTIAETARDAVLHIQCFVCTHSVTLIDRAPYHTINLVRVASDGSRSLQRITSSSGDEIVQFFDDVGRAIGLTNTALLFERAFIVVEGESEASALPIIYRNIYKRSLQEDGLVLVNLHSCSAWKSALEVLLASRTHMTMILLDADCQWENSSGFVSLSSLRELGCSVNFHTEQVLYIGDKEFEDAFSDELITAALDKEFPFPDGELWQVEDIAKMRLESEKFSDTLCMHVRKTCEPTRRNGAKKPGIAAALARQCKSADQTPSIILELFQRVRERAGIVP